MNYLYYAEDRKLPAIFVELAQDTLELRISRGGRTRTGTTQGQRIFILLYVTIATINSVVVWTMSSPYLIRLRRMVYSLYTFILSNFLMLYFFPCKFLLMHDNLDIYILNFLSHYYDYLHLYDEVLMK